MYVVQSLACTVPNSTTPITPAQIAAGAARVAAQDNQMAKLLQGWMDMIDRTPESFTNTLRMPPTEFIQPQTAAALLNVDDNNDAISSGVDSVAAYRASAVCNPVKDGPKVVPLNGVIAALPATQVVDLKAKGPLGPVYGKVGVNVGMGGYRRGVAGCHCGGTCGHCHDGLGDAIPFTGPGSGVVWGAIAGTAFLVWAAFGNKPARRR